MPFTRWLSINSKCLSAAARTTRKLTLQSLLSRQYRGRPKRQRWCQCAAAAITQDRLAGLSRTVSELSGGTERSGGASGRPKAKRSNARPSQVSVLGSWLQRTRVLVQEQPHQTRKGEIEQDCQVYLLFMRCCFHTLLGERYAFGKAELWQNPSVFQWPTTS